MYVIKRVDQGGGYVSADSGQTGDTYVKDLARAKVFTTHEEANASRCPGNEVVVPLSSVMIGLPR